MITPGRQRSSRARASGSSSRRRPRSSSPSGATTRTLGARPLRRAIQRLVEDPLSERILNKEFRAGEIIVVDAEDDPDDPDEKRIVFRAIEGFEPPPMELAGATDGGE